ncbi:hypothetical protein ABZ894_21615 [Nocardia beijingensis]|uniref:hypothetical protein n=1 Tax=Nocardia beijingensis TaxID=95162 RepID=UPI0033F47772
MTSVAVAGRADLTEAVLTAQFPVTVPARLIHQHQWHLAAAPFAAILVTTSGPAPHPTQRGRSLVDDPAATLVQLIAR